MDTRIIPDDMPQHDDDPIEQGSGILPVPETGEPITRFRVEHPECLSQLLRRRIFC